MENKIITTVNGHNIKIINTVDDTYSQIIFAIIIIFMAGCGALYVFADNGSDFYFLLGVGGSTLGSCILGCIHSKLKRHAYLIYTDIDTIKSVSIIKSNDEMGDRETIYRAVDKMSEEITNNLLPEKKLQKIILNYNNRK